MSKPSYIKGVEKLIDPISVGTLHFIQSFNQLLPKNIQKKLIKSSAQKSPYMGFVVEPYSLFLCYEIINKDLAESLLPTGFKLIKTKIFSDDEQKFYCIFGCVRAHTSAFWGSRTEFYIIAQDQKTNLLSWIIIDYNTDTISYDSINGLSAPNSCHTVMTTDYQGNLYVDTKRNDGSNELIVTTNVTNGKINKLDQRLWLEGNLSIGYGRNLSDNGADIFGLKFQTGEVDTALKIPINQVNIQSNTWYQNLFTQKPSVVVCFPYAQHYISDSPGHSSKIRNKNELEQSINQIDFNKVNVFSTKSIIKMFLIGMIVSIAITITLVILLIIK